MALRQLQDLCAPCPVQNVLGRHAPKAIDALVIIPNEDQTPPVGSEAPQDAILQWRRILIFIDEHVIEKRANTGTKAFMLQQPIQKDQ